MSATVLSALSKPALVGLYERMLRIRRFEERVSELFAKGKVPGFVHLYIGQEAVAAGACSVLRQDDYITSTHRGHGHVIAKGGEVGRMMAELFGKATGYCKGKGGSMHIFDLNLGMLGANGIVSGGMPIAIGAAYGAARIRKTDQVVVAFFGDGSTGEGQFHEAMNMAAAWKLPLIFVCENNLYGVSTRIGRVAPFEQIAKRAAGYAMPALTVDGNDVIAVRGAVEEAVKRARSGGGPTFIECQTWRHHGHFEGENTSYMDRTDRERWLARDPLAVFASRLLEAGVATEAELDAVDATVCQSIDEAVAFAESSPSPAAGDAMNDLYR